MAVVESASAQQPSVAPLENFDLQNALSLEPVSLTPSNQSDQSSDQNSSTSGGEQQLKHNSNKTKDCPGSVKTDEDNNSESDYGTDESEHGPESDSELRPKCSAVHTLERDMPDCDYSHLIVELRKQILTYAESNPGTFSQVDLNKCKHDDWFLSRFLLRHKLDMELALDMLKKTLRFNHESLANHLRAQDFPAEFYQLGGIFPHGIDRKGNRMLYLRVKIHKKTPEIASIVQAFIYFNIKRLDDLAQGRGISIVIDCSGGGLANADMDTLLFIISTLKNYFPKGMSYFLVHEIPWILKPFWHLAKAWVPDEHKQLIKFSDSSNILEYIDREELPDFMGGIGAKSQSYSQVPEDCTKFEEAVKLWGIERETLRKVLDKFKQHLPADTVERIEKYFKSTSNNNEQDQVKNDDESSSDD